MLYLLYWFSNDHAGPELELEYYKYIGDQVVEAKLCVS